jgi:positive regulator of sigma E activity
MPKLDSLASLYPEFAKELHQTKNNGLLPEEIGYRSHKKVWWQCSKNLLHIWTTSIGYRTSHKSKCPECATLEKSLQNLYPEIAMEWHPTKNGGFTPSNIASKSSLKVWWICPKGHEYESRILSRSNGSGCSYCDGKKTAPEKSLAYLDPELAMEWHPTRNESLKPEQYTAQSGKKVWWQCNYGHEWQALIGNRHLHKSKCPYCAKKRVHSAYCLENNNPELAMEWHPTKNGSLTPSDVTPGADKKVWWICPKGHEYQMKIYSRLQGAGCSYCAGKKTAPERSLVFLNPEVAKEWHPTKNKNLRPDQFTVYSGKKVWWQCLHFQDHEWEAKIADRTRGNGTRCPHCWSQASNAEYRVVAELSLFFPNLSSKKNIKGKEADIFIPELDLIIEVDGSFWHKGVEKEAKDNKKSLFFEKLGYSIIRLRGRPLRLLSEDDLAFDCHAIKPIDIEILLEKILTKYESSIEESIKDKIKIYISKKNKKFVNEERYLEIRRALPGSNHNVSFAVGNPKLAKEWHPTKNKNLRSDQFTIKSGIKVWWLCEKGHEWEAKIADRTGGHSCPFCSGRKAHVTHCLQVSNPELIKEWHSIKNGNLSPSDVTPRSNQKVWWLCQKGHEWESSPDRRASNKKYKSGCPECVSRKVGKDNNLQTLYSEVAKEWHQIKNGVLTPLDVMPNSKKKVWWQCNKDISHEYQMVVGSKTNGYKCPICSGKIVHISNCLQTKNPELAKEWHPTKNLDKTPFDFTTGSKFKVWWVCPKGHEYQSLILSRSHGHGCPECSNQAKKERAINRWVKYRENKYKESK